MAVYDIPSNELDESEFRHNLTIVLDRVQDPGNLGTIMRIADWFWHPPDCMRSHDTVVSPQSQGCTGYHGCHFKGEGVL